MIKKILLSSAIMLTSLTANAGFHELTFHSRANCVNNETISWWAGHNFTLYSVGVHYLGGKYHHRSDTGWQDTWRSAAVCWGEGRGGWLVDGFHWMIVGGNQTLMARTTVNDCSIYDGWWD